MKVCIARNAEARTNAAIARIAHALEPEVNGVCLLTRNRFLERYGKIRKLKYKISDTGKEIPNYEMGLKSEPGKGIINIFQLVLYQYLVFKWLISNQDKYDVIHAFDLDTGLPALLISIFTNKIYVYHIADFYADSRGSIPKGLKKIIKKLEYMVIDRAETTIICTEKRAEQIKGSKPKKLVVIHNTPSISRKFIEAIDEEKKTKKLNSEAVFTYVGALTEGRFINIVIDVIKRYPMITLNLAGMGRLSEYAKEAANEYPNINYYGMINYHDALKLYSQTDFMFAIYDPNVPNHKYCAPNKVYEAMALGKPIIVAKNTGIDQIVSENNMGLIIEYSEEAFEQIIVQIINGTFNYSELAMNSRKAYTKYAWGEMKNRIKKIYKTLETTLSPSNDNLG